MPWAPNGDYYVFQEASIKAKAPNASGVYGLYNLKQYVLISESADIRDAMLRHERETGFLFGLYRPIGFTFEVCSPESRAERAQQLIAEYRPILPVRDLLSLARWRRRSKNQDVFHPSGGGAKNGTAHDATPIFIVNDAKESAKKFYFSRDQLVVLALAFAVTAVSIGFLGILTGKQIEAMRIVKSEASPGKIPVDPSAGALGTASDVEAGEVAPYFHAFSNTPGTQLTSEGPAKQGPVQGSDTTPSVSEYESVNETTRTAVRKIPDRTNEAPVSGAARPQESPTFESAKREEPVKNWTIQVKASADRGSADVWVDRLKAKGYNAFIVEADVQGRTWYRVRVGSFDSRQEAETLRKMLDSQEGFSDAFLTR